VGVDIGVMAFQPQIVEESVGEFLSSFLEALVIVLVVSFLSLGFRAGVVVALSVPLVLAISLVIMEAMGMNLDRITLGALILSLGLLVDDAIIAVEMMAVKMEEGWNRIEAAAFAWSSTAFPMLSGTLITISGFLPVGFAQSTSGEYAGGIFWVVGITLIVSWFVAVLFTPVLGVGLLPRVTVPSGHSSTRSGMYQTRFHRCLRWIIRGSVRRPVAVVSVTVAMFAAAIFGFARLQQQFFPTSSRTEILVDIRMHEGSSIAATEGMAKRIERLLDPWLETETESGDVLHYATYLGSGAARFFLALNADLPNPSFAKLVIQTRDIQARERVRTLLLNAFASEPFFADASLRVLRLEFGPPIGFPVQFRVVGPDSNEVRRIADQVREVVRQERPPNAVRVENRASAMPSRQAMEHCFRAALGLPFDDRLALVIHHHEIVGAEVPLVFPAGGNDQTQRVSFGDDAVVAGGSERPTTSPQLMTDAAQSFDLIGEVIQVMHGDEPYWPPSSRLDHQGSWAPPSMVRVLPIM